MKHAHFLYRLYHPHLERIHDIPSLFWQDAQTFIQVSWLKCYDWVLTASWAAVGWTSSGASAVAPARESASHPPCRPSPQRRHRTPSPDPSSLCTGCRLRANHSVTTTSGISKRFEPRAKKWNDIVSKNIVHISTLFYYTRTGLPD